MPRPASWKRRQSLRHSPPPPQREKWTHTHVNCSLKTSGNSQGPQRGWRHKQPTHEGRISGTDGTAALHGAGARGQRTRARRHTHQTHTRTKQALRGLPSRALASPLREQVQPRKGPRADTRLLPRQQGPPKEKAGRLQDDSGWGPRGQDRAVDKDPAALLCRAQGLCCCRSHTTPSGTHAAPPSPGKSHTQRQF